MRPRFDRAVLVDMLTYCRPAGSATEREFIAKYVKPLPGAERDPFGNWHVRIDDSPILWSCHTDTVHRSARRQQIRLTPDAELPRKSRSNCLGADDTAGVFLCRQMILAGVPGHYVFHYGEERGGLGSYDLAKHWPALIDHCRCAIALDRRGYGDVITHQGFGRCCSDAFAFSLADELNAHPSLYYTPSDHGIFTDTANFVGIIGECTNLSVGYEFEHSPRETLDLDHVRALLDALCELNSDRLVFERTPDDDDDDGIDWYCRFKYGTTLPRLSGAM